MQSTALQAHDGGRSRLVDTAHGSVHVEVDGDLNADVVVACIHGLPGSARDFTSLGRELRARGACAVRFDMPGFGKSTLSTSALPSSVHTPLSRGVLVGAVMAALDVRRFVVVGHSFGGTAALATAARVEGVSALVMACAVGVTRHHGLSLPHELTGRLELLRRVPGLGEQLAAPFVGAVRSTIAGLGVRGERSYSDDEIVEHTKIIGGIDFADLRRFANEVRVPSLVLSAQDDRLVQPDVASTLAAALRHAPLVSHHHRQTGGHFLQKRAADVIADWCLAATTTR
jgi:pimeloyl-ACP methyl ester carboxylesterase